MKGTLLSMVQNNTTLYLLSPSFSTSHTLVSQPHYGHTCKNGRGKRRGLHISYNTAPSCYSFGRHHWSVYTVNFLQTLKTFLIMISPKHSISAKN